LELKPKSKDINVNILLTLMSFHIIGHATEISAR